MKQTKLCTIISFCITGKEMISKLKFKNTAHILLLEILAEYSLSTHLRPLTFAGILENLHPNCSEINAKRMK